VDFFSRQSGIHFVLNFAARVLLAVGLAKQSAQDNRLWKESPEDLWVLSLVIVGWYPDKLTERERESVTASFQGAGLDAFFPALNLFHDVLAPFARSALAATSTENLASSAVYLNAALTKIGFDALGGAMGSPLFRRVAAILLAKHPLRAELANKYTAGIGVSLAKDRAGSQSRAERFERADSKPVQRVQPTPKLSALEALTALLHMRGYSLDEIEAIKRGPRRTS